MQAYSKVEIIEVTKWQFSLFYQQKSFALVTNFKLHYLQINPIKPEII